MTVIRKALFSLFGGPGNLPKEEDLNQVAREIFKKVCDSVEDDVDGQTEPCITKRDMYAYLVQTSECGISGRSVDKLFERVDVNGDGTISEPEFIQVIKNCYKMLAKDKAFEERLTHEVPDNHVVRGSTAMNGRSGTTAFRMQVVRRRSMKRLWELFKDIDIDGDGKIGLAEFKRHLTRNQPSLSHMSTSIFHSLDKKTAGLVTFRQLLVQLFPEASREDVQVLMRMARPKNYLPSAKPDEQMMSDIRNVFMVYDDDHSGSLDNEEFVHAMTLCGFSEEEAASMFSEVDRDGSGEVSYEEFEIWYSNNHQRQQAKILQDAENDSDDD